MSTEFEEKGFDKLLRQAQDIKQKLDARLAILDPPLNDYIGRKVVKESGKPFKSQRKINTIAGMTLHPKMNTPCWTFKEDDSYVECHRCQFLEEIPA